MPAAQKKTRGRPAFVPTPAQRRRVAILAGAGTPHETIAITMAISQPTLLKYFSFELTQGAYQKRAEVLEAMHRAAKKGNVAAQKAYAAMAEPKVAVPPPVQPSDEQAAAASDKPEGKKAQAQADAVTAAVGTEWDQLLPRTVQ